MILKERTEPLDLLQLRALAARMDLGKEVNASLLNKEKGYKGECVFDVYLQENLQNQYLLMKDLQLKNNSQKFQIDSLLLLNGEFYILDSKYNEGEYYISDEKWYTIWNHEISNPLTQLTRAETNFRRLLQELNYRYPIKSYLVYVNPEFTLYHAPTHSPIILPSFLKSFVTRLNQVSSTIRDQDLKLARQIVSLHNPIPPYSNLPQYDFQQLKKLIPCRECRGEVGYHERKRHVICPSCGSLEPLSQTLSRCVKDFQLLFPNSEITTKVIYDWCGGVLSKRIIRRFLSKNFKVVGSSKSTHYINGKL